MVVGGRGMHAVGIYSKTWGVAILRMGPQRGELP